jgi:hypothetical protein
MTTAVYFKNERRAYYEAVAAETELELLASELEEAERQLARREGGHRQVRALGLPVALAPVVEVLIYSPSRSARLRAAGVIGRTLLRAAREAA